MKIAFRPLINSQVHTSVGTVTPCTCKDCRHQCHRPPPIFSFPCCSPTRLSKTAGPLWLPVWDLTSPSSALFLVPDWPQPAVSFSSREMRTQRRVNVPSEPHEGHGPLHLPLRPPRTRICSIFLSARRGVLAVGVLGSLGTPCSE